jgi:predicted Zn-dependent peptidase
MKSIKFLLFVFICSISGIYTNAQGLKAFKLPNGLNVFVWEDETVADIFGMVAVNAGSKEDPEQYTGLAHYLEHMMFNGTENIGALNWEKEKPLYEQIIAKYDEHAQATDPVQREAILKEINQLTKESAQYYISKDFSNLVQGMGGESLNAGTNYDYTVYYNSFPPGEIYKWLELYSERLINPVFRNFQPELETVYEEYNMYQDRQSSREQEFIFNTIFPGHPYSRSIIGLPEHLKNPQLSQLVQFYKNWYVPENMALILVGNIKTNEILAIVKEKFGRLESRPLPERKTYPETALKGRKEVSAKLSYYPQVLLVFPGITTASEDDIALDICISILSNASKTGMLDKLALDGDLQDCSASALSLKERGNILVAAIPYFDVNQRRFESLKTTEKILFKEIKKLQDGQFEDWLFESIKARMIRVFDLAMESPEQKASQIAETFLSGKSIGNLLNYKALVEAITVDEIKAAAKRYFGSDYYAILLNEGKPEKGKELEKPKYEPIIPPRDAETDYSKAFHLLPVKFKNAFADMNSVTVRPINDRSKLYYTPNQENDIFTLVLKYGVGTKKMPKLELAAPLVNNAGILGSLEAQEVKQAFSNLGATCRYQVDENYLYVIMEGFEANMEEACRLMTRQILLPKLDEKQMNSLLGGQFQYRKIEKSSNEIQSDALREYLLYGKQSNYIDRLPLEEIISYSVSDLTGEFQRATDYEAEIHYVGSRPVEDVYDILNKNLPLKQGEKVSTSPEIKDKASYAENTVFFLPNSDAKQSSIYFFIQGDDYSKEEDPQVEAFNQYFGGGFNGLILQEIREYRSMAYTAGGLYVIPPLADKKACFVGSIGTQADKTLEAIEVYHDLLTNMPQYADRLRNIKDYMKETASVEKPQFRNASRIYESWKRRGYTQSPAQTNQKEVQQLTFDDIVKFYNKHIQGRPIAIAIVGNPKMIDEKALAKYGKVTKLSNSKIFNDK